MVMKRGKVGMKVECKIAGQLNQSISQSDLELNKAKVVDGDKTLHCKAAEVT